MPFQTSESFVAAAETQLGMQFPASLRSHLIADNGGELDLDDDTWWLFAVADNSDRKRLARSANHIVRETAKARTWSGFPAKAVAIAHNGSGDCLILLPNEADPTRLDSALYLWDHETGLHEWAANDMSDVPGFRGSAA